MSTAPSEPPIARGGCLCGAVRYELRGAIRDVINCHCSQCRLTHGAFAGYAAVRRPGFTLTEGRGLKWYASSEFARRGFCQDCGASLFWDRGDEEHVSVIAGSFDQPSGLKTIRHIFVARKGDFYEITDDLEQFPEGQGSHALPVG